MSVLSLINELTSHSYYLLRSRVHHFFFFATCLYLPASCPITYFVFKYHH